MPLPRIQVRILDELCKAGDLSTDSADTLLASTEDWSGEGFEAHLLETHKVDPARLLLARSRAVEMPPFAASHFQRHDKSFERLDMDFCRDHTVLPIGVVGSHFVFALADPFDTDLISRIGDITRLTPCPLLALATGIQAHLKQEDSKPDAVGFGDVLESLNIQYGTDADGEISEEDLEDDSSPIVQLASRIIEEAYYSGGSDIHIEPFENEARVRVRVDGICQAKLSFPPKVCRSLLARLKVMANLDIAERRLPQDGRIVYKQFNRKNIDVDLRVSTAPLNYGEGCVMRILDKQKSTLPLTALGFSPENLERYREIILRPYGMILHCGPTGSGKSMTLYSALNEINDPELCIRTAEDPIEYTLPGLCQMQMHRKIGLTFAAALRAFLRQDPDIILVGEIRDKETAQIAVEAALTGHLLFSTLHTNDAPGTISRLTEMDIEPFMISASLLCVCAQRLLRRACKTCRQLYEPEGRERDLMLRALDWSGPVHRAPTQGCPACGGVGYKGRVGIHELMVISEDLVKGINGGYETAKLKRICIRNGMKTLHQDSLLKVRDGITTIHEAIGNVPADMEDIRKIMAAATLAEVLADD
jgi:type IV pilus assembly protein PilB